MSQAQLDALLVVFAQGREREPVDLAARRARAERFAAGFAPTDVRFEAHTIAGVPVEAVIASPSNETGPTLLFAHGGAYVSLSPRTHRRLTAEAARHFPGRVLSVDYRLAPEHPYPAGVEDFLSVLAALRAVDPRVVLFGDSAGAGLVMSALLALKAADLPQPPGAWLISPWTDLTLTARAFTDRASSDPIISRADLDACADLYLAGVARDDPRVSSVFADCRGLAPTLIQVGTREALLDDAVSLARAYAAADGEATLRVWSGMIHSFPAMAGLLDEADAAVAEGVAWARARLGV